MAGTTAHPVQGMLVDLNESESEAEDRATEDRARRRVRGARGPYRRRGRGPAKPPAQDRLDKGHKMKLLDLAGIWHPGINRGGRAECTIANFVKIPLIAKALRILEVKGRSLSQEEAATITQCLDTSYELSRAAYDQKQAQVAQKDAQPQKEAQPAQPPIRPVAQRLVLASEDDKKTQELVKLRSEVASSASASAAQLGSYVLKNKDSIQKLLDVNARLQKLAVDQDAEIKKLRKLVAAPFQDIFTPHQIASSQLISECVIDGQPCSTFVVEANSPYQMSDSVGKCFTVLTCMLRVTV